jgi:hypothetical protein
MPLIFLNFMGECRTTRTWCAQSNLFPHRHSHTVTPPSHTNVLPTTFRQLVHTKSQIIMNWIFIKDDYHSSLHSVMIVFYLNFFLRVNKNTFTFVIKKYMQCFFHHVKRSFFEIIFGTFFFSLHNRNLLSSSASRCPQVFANFF